MATGADELSRMDEDIEKNRAAGFSKHLTKPVNIETLEAALRQVAGV